MLHFEAIAEMIRQLQIVRCGKAQRTARREIPKNPTGRRDTLGGVCSAKHLVHEAQNGLFLLRRIENPL